MTDKRTETWEWLKVRGYTRNGGQPQETPKQGSSKVQVGKPKDKSK